MEVSGGCSVLRSAHIYSKRLCTCSIVIYKGELILGVRCRKSMVHDRRLYNPIFLDCCWSRLTLRTEWLLHESIAFPRLVWLLSEVFITMWCDVVYSCLSYRRYTCTPVQLVNDLWIIEPGIKQLSIFTIEVELVPDFTTVLLSWIIIIVRLFRVTCRGLWN